MSVLTCTACNCRVDDHRETGCTDCGACAIGPGPARLAAIAAGQADDAPGAYELGPVLVPRITRAPKPVPDPPPPVRFDQSLYRELRALLHRVRFHHRTGQLGDDAGQLLARLDVATGWPADDVSETK